MPDPVKPFAAAAIEHLTVVYADSLAATAKAFGGFPDTDTATCTAADRYELDLRVTPRRGIAYTRVGFVDPIDSINELGSATATLVQRSRAS